MSRSQQTIGKAGQDVAAAALSRVGVELVEQIGSPVRLVPHRSLAGYYQVIWGEKVSGDHRGILPGGRAVLAETKTILDRNLQWSDLREHQPEALSRYAELGGLSLLVWVHSSGVYVMQWPVPGFAPRTSISPERARQLDVEKISSISTEKELESLRSDNEKLTEQLNDWGESYRKIIADGGCPDEVHCACVPVLRDEIARLRAALESTHANY